MDESRGYIQLGRNRNAGATADARFTMNHLSPPIDRCNCIYMALMLAGVGFLLPYNSFIMAVDYYQSRFPGSTIVFDMSFVYILTAFAAVLCSNLLVETLSLNTRITFGYVISFLTLLFVATCEIWWDMFGATLAYRMTLAAVAVVALGCTVQQSSFYGYTSMLPSRYTQAVMTGESAAGFLVSINRILTKLLLDDQRANTVIFFILSIIIVLLCFALHHAVRRSDFVRFYLALCSQPSRIVLEPCEDMNLMEEASHESRGQYGVLKLQQSPPPAEALLSSTAFSFANPVYEPGGAQPTEPTGGVSSDQPSAAAGCTFKVEDVVVRMGGGAASTRRASGFKRGLRVRWEVTKLVWPYMTAIGAAYLVTLCLYPGIEAEIVSCRFGSWMPVILMAIFNACDLIGKVVSSVPWPWTRGQLLGGSAARVLLVPLLLLCAAPRHRPLIPGDAFPMFFSAVLGLSNGVLGSIPMIHAPSKVPEEYREMTGNIMTLSYNLGLTLGSVAAYLLDHMLGPPVMDMCAYSPLSRRPVSPFTTTLAPTSTLGPANVTAAVLIAISSSLAPFSGVTTPPGVSETLQASTLPGFLMNVTTAALGE